MLTPNPMILLEALFSNYESIPTLQCPSCSNRDRIHKHGFYWRYHLLGDGMEAIPRFRCLNPQCQRQTFSILPYPYLRWVRHRALYLLALLAWFLRGTSQSALSRWWNRSRPVLRRALIRAKQLRAFLNQEIRAGTPDAFPWMTITSSWTAFTQAVSHFIYPHLQIQAAIPHESSMGTARFS